MKIVVFGPDRRVGALHGDMVIDLAAASARRLRETGAASAPEQEGVQTLVPSDLRGFIEAGQPALDRAQEAVQHVLAHGGEAGAGEPGVALPLSTTHLHTPRASEARIACAGGNFSDHAIAMAAKRGAPQLARAEADDAVRKNGIWGFWKVTREALDPEGDLIYPAKTQRLDYEGEVAIVLGKRAKNVRADDWRAYVWGVTLFGDWSIRDLHEGNAPYKFAMGKNFDTSYSMGPCIVVGELDAANVDVETLVDGDVRQHYNTGTMVFSFGEFLEYLTADFTLYPGDVISGGTSAGTAQDSSPLREDGTVGPERFLKPGSLLEVRSPQIGSLRARVVPA